mmetsp:Transcript_21148/g.34091  ORF Transcript_21148/g.34091 Transcript_21148/m.34091 type:complete len:313 (-) Transcript_21148:132-1070(-)
MAVPESEISALLDQCSQDELASILQAIEGEELGCSDSTVANESQAQTKAFDTKAKMRKSLTNAHRSGELQSCIEGYRKEEEFSCDRMETNGEITSPVPPSSPPRPGNPRRPIPGGYKKPEEVESPVSVRDMQVMLEEHSMGVLNEVRKLIPTTQVGNADTQSGALSLEMLTTMLAQRDQEVKSMENYLSELQIQLQAKDQRVADLGMELEGALREVRHRQLDLEFQQLKLEERVRTNAELEQAQRSLVAQVEEASLNSRHAALEVDIGRKSPRSARVQGSLPWMLRKNRQPWDQYESLTDKAASERESRGPV